MYLLKITRFLQFRLGSIAKNCKNYGFNSAADLNTNVAKDVILYKYDNPKFFKYLNLFGLCQFGFWGYLSAFSLQTLRDAPVDESPDAPWYRRVNLGDNKFRNTIAASAFILGYGILVISWMYTLRSVRYLILRKGGRDMTIVTYSPFGRNRMFTLNLSNISCKESRSRATSLLPLKVKGHYFHYVLDMRGEFKNEALFDQTAGLKRVFS